jgi:hypothetical protein
MKKQIIFISLLLIQFDVAEASFSQGQKRYISGHEFLQRITDIGVKFQNYSNCLELSYRNVDNILSLGANLPSIGRPLFTSPTAGTVQVLSECVIANMSFNSAIYTADDLNAFISDDFQRIVHAAFPKMKLKKEQLYLNWSVIPSQAKYFLVADLVEKIMGTDAVIEDYGLVESAESFRHEILNQLNLHNSNLNVEKILQKIVVTLVLRDEFLSY